MPICWKGSLELTPDAQEMPMADCPNCGRTEPPMDVPKDPLNSSRTDLARVASVAEAGYLVSLLEEARISATARPAESFNAVHGAWTPSYHISVPTAEADIARKILQAESESGFGEIAEQLFHSTDSNEHSPTVNPWRMLTVLAVVAAAGAVFVTDRLGGRAQPVRREAAAGVDEPKVERLTALVGALRESPTPLATLADAIGPRQQLRYSPATDILILSTDADRDGRFESHRRFTTTPLEP